MEIDTLVDLVDYATGNYRKKFNIFSRKFPNDHGQFTPWELPDFEQGIENVQSLFETIIFNGIPISYNYLRNLLNSGNTHKIQEGQKIMAYLKRFVGKRKRRTYKKNSRFQRKSSRYSPRKFKKSLQRKIMPEMKRAVICYGPTFLTPYVTGTDYHRSHFPVPPRGTASNNRIGREIQCYGFTVKGFIAQASTEKTPKYTKGSLRIFLDINPNGSLIPTTQNILDTFDTGGTTLKPEAITNSLVDSDKRNKFFLIKEVLFELDGIREAGYNYDFFIKKSLLQQFSGDQGLWSDIITNGLVMILSVDCLTGSQGDNNPIVFQHKLYTHFIDA